MIVRLAVCCWVSVSFVLAEDRVKPQLQLAKTYTAATKGAELDLANYWVSEKLDGVRGFWDGRVLRTRSGREIHAPEWFIAGFPTDVAMDGELWIERGKFDLVSGIVRKETAVDSEWSAVRYCIFDLPKHSGPFDERVQSMRKLVAELNKPQLQVVRQYKVASQEELQKHLAKVVEEGGEGLMLHRGKAHYQAKRTNDLIKLKPLDDAEAVVVSHVAGKGKYRGMLGALVVEMANGAQFKIGSGFSDEERKFPPKVGSTVTYQHNGFTSKGLPRFARFMRVRKAQ